nr:MAG TPA: hypothetical protein [Siphoviridae sp. ctngg6]
MALPITEFHRKCTPLRDSRYTFIAWHGIAISFDLGFPVSRFTKPTP